MDPVTVHLKALRHCKRLTREEEVKLAKKARLGDRHARTLLVESCAPYVVRIASKYVGRGVDFEDLICEGNRGLLRAVDKFDPNRGTRLTTYATNWIVHFIRLAMTTSSTVIHMPASYTRKTKIARDHMPRIVELDSIDTDQVESLRIENSAEQEELIESVGLALCELEPRLQDVIRGRMEGETLQEVGWRLGVTRERVRQIEQRALGKLRESRHLAAYAA